MKQLLQSPFKSSPLLTYTSKCSYYQSKRLHIFEGGNRNSISGIRATIFGATGFVGPYVGAILGYISSDLIFPHIHKYIYDDDVKELKLCAGSGQSFLVKHMDFDNMEMIDRVIKNSNVVINLIGPRTKVKRRGDFERINIELPRRIAEACRKNPNIKRLIHFSAAGAEKDSLSTDLQTKWTGEQAVREEFPEATILRPTTIYGMNDYFVRLWMGQKEYLYNFNVVTDDCKAKRQPILVHDIAQCVLNALKLDETVGRTYELGGPHVYSMLEIYEILHNICGKPPKLAYFNHNLAVKMAQALPNWEYFSLEQMVKNKIDLVVKEDARKIDELYVKPVTFQYGVDKMLGDFKIRPMEEKMLDER